MKALQLHDSSRCIQWGVSHIHQHGQLKGYSYEVAEQSSTSLWPARSSVGQADDPTTDWMEGAFAMLERKPRRTGAPSSRRNEEVDADALRGENTCISSTSKGFVPVTPPPRLKVQPLPPPPGSPHADVYHITGPDRPDDQDVEKLAQVRQDWVYIANCIEEGKSIQEDRVVMIEKPHPRPPPPFKAAPTFKAPPTLPPRIPKVTWTPEQTPAWPRDDYTSDDGSEPERFASNRFRAPQSQHHSDASTAKTKVFVIHSDDGGDAM